MKHWSQDKTDRLAKREKIRKSRRSKRDLAGDLSSQNFELKESEWPCADQGEQELFAARVVEVHKKYAFVSVEPTWGDIRTEDVWLATVARKYTQTRRQERNFITVGDRVLCRPGSQEGSQVSEDLPSAIIENRAPRISRLARLDPLTPEREHVLAVNMDQLVIVASYVFPKVKWGLIDRYLLLAEEQGLRATLILNKKDLLLDQSQQFQDECSEYTDIYRGLGYDVLSVQAHRPGKDAGAIRKVFANQISLVAGHSGVGKSSLVNLLEPEISQDVETESILTKGRHTTTYSSFIRLGVGGYVIDTPGIRSFMLSDRSPIDLNWAFVEMRPFQGLCKFRECRHIDEPGCEVIKAVQEGRISRQRYKSYLTILTGASGREGRIRDL
ncbi:MAG: ribosome small subunit-dependent GTPase A [Deltaproteobacteria bacterium]|nr:ribosome small subunit-dependent GTPase A [Deltaproteobacteria bacterium]